MHRNKNHIIIDNVDNGKDGKTRMIQLGEKQTLTIVKKEEFGVYLADVAPGEKEYEDIQERILLPIKQVASDAKIGDGVEVFVYRDSKDRLIATTNMPKITLHKVLHLITKYILLFSFEIVK